MPTTVPAPTVNSEAEPPPNHWPLPVHRRSAGHLRRDIGPGVYARSVRENTRCMGVQRQRIRRDGASGRGTVPSTTTGHWQPAKRGQQERCKREELDFESSPRSPPHLQENEPQKPSICDAPESCTPHLLRVITHPTIDKAKPGAQEFAHCSEGGRSTQGSAELTAPALPKRSDSAMEETAVVAVASLAGVN